PPPPPPSARLGGRSAAPPPRIAGGQARPLRQLVRHYALRRRSPHQHASARRLFRIRRQSRSPGQSRRQLDANGTSSRLERFWQGNYFQPNLARGSSRISEARRIRKNHRSRRKESLR